MRISFPFEKAALLPDTLATAEVMLVNLSTGKSLKALPIKGDNTIMFVADDVEANTYPAVTVSWSGRLLDKDISFKGNYDPIILLIYIMTHISTT